MILSDIQAVAARSDYLIRVTLDYKYVPYNNWSMASGQSAQELALLITYLKTWPRNRLFISQPVGDFQPCDMCDLQTLLYLFYTAYGWCKPAVVDNTACTSNLNYAIAPDVVQPATPTFGSNQPSYLIATEGGQIILADNVAPYPCFRDWVALGLGTPPKPAVDPKANQFNPWAPAPG